MASGGSRQRKTRWDDSRGRQQDEPTVPAPPPPPEPGGGESTLNNTDCGREPNDGRGAADTREQQDENRTSLDQHVHAPASHELWGQKEESKASQEPWGHQEENKTSQSWGQQGDNAPHDPWGQQGDNKTPHDLWGQPQQGENRVSQEPWSQQNDNMPPNENCGQQEETMTSQEPWVQQGENRTSQEPWVQPGETRPPQEPWMPPGVEPWAPPGVGRGAAEAWAPPGVGGGPTEPWVTAGLGSGVVEAWAPPGASGIAEPWAPPAVGRGTAEPWLPPGVGRGVIENWLPPGVARGAAESWVPPGVGRGAVETWVPPGVGRGAAEPWVPPGVGRGAADPWFPPGVGRGAAEPWGPPGMGRGAMEQWAPPGVGRGAAEPWVPPGMGRGAAAPWPPPGMGRGATDIWVPPGVGRGAADPSMQHPDSNAPGHPGQGTVSQQPWGQHGENRAFHEQQGWPSQEPWSQHGDNLAIQEQHGWASQEHWGHEEENKWRASQDSWGQQWRGRGSREPWGKQWEGRDHGSQKQWKQQGDGRERGSHGPWGNQVDGRGRRSRAPWGHQGEGRDRGSRAPWGQRGDRGDNRGRGSHVPWGHHGEGRGRGSRAPWGQQNRGSQDSWRQQGEPRDRGSQKPWGHPGENRDGHAHEQWVQQWDGRERGSRDSWGQQERGSQDNWKRQGEGSEGGPATPWGQQGEDKGKGTTEQWGNQTVSGEGGGGVPREQPTEVSEGEIPGPWGQQGGEIVFPEHIIQPEANRHGQSQELMGFHGVAIEGATEETLRQQVCGRAGLKDPESQQQDVSVHELQEHERSQKESMEVLSQEPGVQRQDDAEKKLDDLAWKQIEVRQSGSQEPVELQDGMGGLFQINAPYQMESTEMVSGEPVKLDEEMRTKGLEESVGQVDTKDLSVEHEKVKSRASEETVWEQKDSERISTEPLCQHDDVRKKESVEPIEHHEQDSDKGSEMPTGQEGSGREIFLEEPVNPYEQCIESGSTAFKGQPGESVEEPVPHVDWYRESGSEVPMDQHGVDQDVLSKESTELHKMLSECVSHGPVGQQVVNRETSSIEPVGWQAMDRDMRSTEPAEQHDTFRERGSDVPLGQQGVSSETVSIEPMGWQGMHATFRERGSEVPVGDHGVSRETVSIESVGWQGVDRDMRSTEPAEQHEAFKERGSDVPLGQERVSREIVSNEPVGWQGMERDIRSAEPAEQYEASWERGSDVPVEQQGVDTAGHSHEQLFQNVCRGSEFKQPLVQHEEGRKNESAEPLEQYKEYKGHSLADHSMQHEKDLVVLSLEPMAKQREDKEGLSWEGQKMFSEETVGSDVKDVSLETVVQQVEGLKYSEEGDKQPEECNVRTISTSTGPHEEIEHWDKSKKAVSEEEFVEAIIPCIKEKVEDGEAGIGAETQRLMTKAHELTGTSKEKLHSNKERREKQDDEVNVRELKAKECSTATELITEHNIQEHRGANRERKHRSRDKGRAEEEVCGVRVKEISASKEEHYGAGDEMKHRVDDHRERRRSIKEVEKTFVEDVDCGGGTKEIRVEEGGAYDVKAEMKHRRQKGHEETRESHKERKHSKRESEQSFGDGDDGKRIKDMTLDEEEEYGARTEMKHRRQRSHEEERGSYGEKRRRGREKERTFEDEECEEGMNPWDCRKNDGAGEDAMGQWSGVIEETRELEDDRKTSEIKRLSSKRKERKREKEEDGGRERKHKGKERREKHEGEASGEKKHGSSRKKRRREKSWEEEEEEEEEDDGIPEKKHRSRDRRREKHRVGEEDCGEGDMMHWGEGKREEGDMDREQWGYSREVGVLDEGADMTGEMMYWSGREREHHDGDMAEFEWKHMHSRKERKRVQGEDEAGSGRKHSGGRDKHRKREEDDGGEDGVGDMKSSRKRDRKREHEDDMGGERKHRSSRKKQRRREEEECRGSVSKQWNDSEKERLKEGLLDLEEENCERGKPHGESREKMNEEDDGGGLELKHGRSRPMDKNKEEDEVENYLSVLEQERNRATAEVLHQGETTQESGREKEMKREKTLYEPDKEVGGGKHDALQEKENHKDDVAQSRHGVYMEIERNYMQAADGEEKLYHDGDKERERTELSAEGRRHIRHSRESRREMLVTENVFEVAHTLNSEEINVTVQGNIIREDVKHATGLEQRSYQPEEIVGVVEHAPEMDMKGIGEAERKHEFESRERRTPLDGEDEDGKGHEFLGGKLKHGHGMDRKEELEDEGEQLMDAPGREESNSIHMKDTGRDEIYAPESNEGKYVLLIDGEVEHASGIEGKLESIDVDGGGDTNFETVLEQNVSGEQHQEADGPEIKEVEGLRKPWLSPSIEEGGSSANPETENRRGQLLSPSPLKHNDNVADGEKKLELLLPLASFSHDGSIRERERRRELLLKSLASFKEGEAGSGDGERDMSLLVPPLPSKENSGGSAGMELEKIELLSTPPVKQVLSVGGRVRKKDLLFPPPSKEESVVGKEERLPSPPPPKEADGEERWVGPLPTEASQTKKRKVLEFERVYLDNLPSATMYERSYMHRDVITHVACTKTDFIITASHDGHVKFWKKVAEGIEFVKHFRSHLGVVECIAVSSEGALFCSVGDDQAMKVFDVVNFDMINMLKLGYCPGQCEWLFCPGDAISAVASSEKSTGKIFVYDGRGSNKPMHVFERLHSSPLTHIRLNPIYKVVVSSDKTGMIEYWTGPPQEYNFPKNVHWEYKTDTDLYEFAKCKTYLTSLCFSPDGKKMATIGSDRKVRIFRFLTGKLMRVFDESLSMFTELQQMRQQLPDMEFGRRMAVERELEKVDAIKLINIIFDETGHFVLYGTMLGIKVINVETNRCVRILGKQENVRMLQIAMFQGVARKHRAAATIEMKASDNPVLMSIQADPTIVCTAFKKNRFYLFSKREPEDTKSADSDRDVFNEKPSKEEVMAATQAEGPKRVSDSAIVHTSMGDVHVKLFPVECPKTVENFCVHSRNGYYNGHTFHRIIKGFMVQTGDPSGTGMGGESIWGGEFEDEFHSTLRHDRPYTLSMANAGPNSNGSQFFLTVVPTPWLDNKHTVFGRVTKGMEVVQRISNVKVNPKTDKPYEDISIISITVK